MTLIINQFSILNSHLKPHNLIADSTNPEFRVNTFVKPEKHGLRNELYAKSVVDSLPDFTRQSQDIFGFGSTSIYQRKRVLRGEARGSDRIAFRKSGVFDQPCCGSFYVTGNGGIPRNV